MHHFFVGVLQRNNLTFFSAATGIFFITKLFFVRNLTRPYILSYNFLSLFFAFAYANFYIVKIYILSYLYRHTYVYTSYT